MEDNRDFTIIARIRCLPWRPVLFSGANADHHKKNKDSDALTTGPSGNTLFEQEWLVSLGCS